MKIFDKRPLSLILCMLLGGFVFFSVSNAACRIAIASIAAVILLFALFVPLKEFKGRILTGICAVAIMIGCLFSFLYFDLYHRLDKRFDGEVEITGVVIEYESFSYGKNLGIKIETVNGENYNGRTVFAFLTLDESENISNGSRIRLTGEIKSFVDEFDSDSASYYMASGYSAVVTNITSTEYVEFAGLTFKSRISNYRDALCRRIIINSDRESGGLLCALLLGERGYLSSETRHDFARVGLSHVLALSGMHLAILSFAIEMFLSKLSIMKNPRKLIQMVFVVAYMALTGFPASVMRAGIMLLISSLLFLLSHRADSITSLFVAVTVILIAEPYATFDIGLWLSAFATLGILLFIEFYESVKTQGKPSAKMRLFRILVLPVAISVFAFGGTFLTNALAFENFSLLAPITTPVYSIIIEAYMYLGMLLLVCGGFLCFGNLTTVVGKLIIASIRGISKINGIYISAENIITIILLVLFTVAFLAFALLDIKRKKSAIALLVCMVFTIFATAFGCSVYFKNTDRFEYSLSGNKEWILMQSDGAVSLLDTSAPSATTVSIQVSELQDYGVTEIDSYIFTSYASYTPSAIEKLLGAIYVKDVYLPSPQGAEELALAQKVIEGNIGSKAEFHFYKSEEFISCGVFDVFPAYRSADTNKQALTILYRDQFYTYLSSGMLENDTKNVALPLIDGCNTLILGRHGNSYSNYKFIYQIENLDRLVVSSNHLDIPAETIRFYDAQGTKLYYSPEELKLYVE